MRIALSFGDLKKMPAYRDAAAAGGLVPMLNPDSMEGLSGLMLAGGTDVDPALYGQERHPKTENPDTSRDTREQRLIHEALSRDVPILAICRGQQLLNVVLGGTLIQHLDSAIHERRTPDPSERAHDIEVHSGTKLAEAVGAGRHPVNSRHHQAIDRLAEGLRVTAIAASDNVIEGVDLPDKQFVVGVQWHPEDRFLCPADRKLFETFASAVRQTK